MPDEKTLLIDVVKAAGKLHASSAAITKLEEKMRKAQARANALSPSRENGETEPDNET